VTEGSRNLVTPSPPLSVDALETFRREICAFLTDELTPEARRRHRDPRAHNGWGAAFSTDFRRRMAGHGFLDRGWPVEFGGGGPSFQLVLNEELQYHTAPGVDPTGSYVPSVLITFGTGEQQERFLPLLRRGEVTFFLGYSEAEAGSDLANLKTFASKEGDGFAITGQKMYSSYADRADFGLVIARTDPDGERDRGLTLFIVDMREPGVEIAEHETIAGWLHHSVYFHHVRVPRSMVVGEVHGGWPVVMGAIDFERATIAQPGRLDRQLDRLVAYALAPRPDGSRPVDDRVTCDRVVGISVEIEAARLYCHSLFRREAPGHAGTLAALLGLEAARAADLVGVEELGLHAQLRGHGALAPFDGAVEHEYREHTVLQFAAGGFDVSRNILATRALGLRRSRSAAEVRQVAGADLTRLLSDPTADDDRDVLLAEVARIASELSQRFAQRTRRHAAFDRGAWKEMADLGWLGADQAEEVGGTAVGIAPAALIAEAFGAAGVLTPLVDCGIGAGALIASAPGAAHRVRLLEPLVTGSALCAPAVHEQGRELFPEGIHTTLRKSDDGFLLSGTKMFVPYAAEASALICVCRTGPDPADLALVLVDPGATGVKLTQLRTSNDDPQYAVTFAGVAVDDGSILARGGDVWPIVEATIDRCAAVTAAELLGIGRTALSLTLAYVQERVQFGRPLARFQVVQHHCVDMFRDLEQTRILTEAAVQRLDSGLDGSRAVSLAKIKASESVGAIVRTAHQLHGGIGYYTDYPLERLYRRALRAQAAWGSPRWHRSRLAGLLGEDPARFRRDGAHPLPQPVWGVA
jgi:alkylation response protein AidB-like acyl-CoA dehydrogenase